MKVELINIGDELLIGQTINTNASWIGQFFSENGIRIYKCTTIQDEKNEIINQLNLSLSNADVVILTGGLGPTKDDITKETLCEYFGGTLEMHQPTLEKVTDYFKSRGREMLQVNINQALLPNVCTVLTNNNGTAPGMWFEQNDKIVISLPGVPYEMKPLIQEEVLPRLKNRFLTTDIFQVSIVTTGIGESFLAEKIKDWENKLRNNNLSLAYLPSPGIVRLRVTSYQGKKDEALVNSYITELKEIIGSYYYGDENITLSETIGKLLIQQKATIGTVESCTSGALAAEITKTAGASAYFEGSFLTYSNRLKTELVGVSEEILSTHGAVSQSCVEEMAVNGRNILATDYCLSTSGIAGPDGGTIEKPVGTIWIALADKNGVISKEFKFGNNRERNVQMSVFAAMNMLRLRLLGHI
jgi:nicotinamide-nucleotide amidase